MSSLTGMFFLRFQRVGEDKVNVTRGQIANAVGHNSDKELGAYVVRFPRPDGKPSHSALVHAAEFTNPEFVLFDNQQQLQEFLAAQQAAAQPAPPPPAEALVAAPAGS